MKQVYGREPAVFFAMLATLLQGATLFFNLAPDVQGYVNAVLLAGAGFATAATVSVEKALPALVGLIKAGFALVLALGIQLPDTTQVAVLTVVTALGAFFVRQNVVAPVSPVLGGKVLSVRHAQ